MTTIAIKDGIIAYDSRVTSNGVIMDNDFDKHVVVSGVDFFICGSTCDYDHFLNLYFGKAIPVEFKHVDCSALVVDADGKVVKAAVDDDCGIVKTPIKSHMALGSGTISALTAMDMGATSKEAVKWAMERDVYTGGRIRVFKID
ncbi:MAG: hypothetical protein R8K20_11325 [Gallionellaceae bacterium]